jgi:hypothetical protein
VKRRSIRDRRVPVKRLKGTRGGFGKSRHLNHLRIG